MRGEFGVKATPPNHPPATDKRDRFGNIIESALKAERQIAAPIKAIKKPRAKFSVPLPKGIVDG